MNFRVSDFEKTGKPCVYRYIDKLSLLAGECDYGKNRKAENCNRSKNF